MPIATSLAAVIKKELGIKVILVEGHGGVFTVDVNGTTVFDKAGKPGKPHPPILEIVEKIRKI